MKITIWSDYNCPFCYIGQAHLDKALETFEHADDIEIEYKSFQLNPNAQYQPGVNYAEHLAQGKGMSLEQVNQMLAHVENMAAEAGLPINFDKAIEANSFDAHRVFQKAKGEGLGTEYYKRFYQAHFVDGENTSDHETITKLAGEVGLNEEEVKALLADPEANKAEVQEDIAMAQGIGVQGVPFFVFDEKYALSGAQPVEVFSQALDQIYHGKIQE